MADPTSNLNVVQADKFFVWDAASKTHVNLQNSIVGLAPATLSTLQALASAVGNDPAFSTSLGTSLSALHAGVDSKADAFTVGPPLLWSLDPGAPQNIELTVDSYTRQETDDMLAPKAVASVVNAAIKSQSCFGKPHVYWDCCWS